MPKEPTGNCLGSTIVRTLLGDQISDPGRRSRVHRGWFIDVLALVIDEIDGSELVRPNFAERSSSDYIPKMLRCVLAALPLFEVWPAC